MSNDQTVTSFSANKKWLAIPKEIRKKLEQNVWCSSCSEAVTIEKYVVEDSPAGIVLKGKCKQCGRDVARVID
ncbi:hypothetical protein [Bacillus sp. USDA818B3_A]|uniref:hypothetical protein n=1 Tax=Bacillus sp. USDA818B3_A TaxID=2698834 RepID=UPI001368565E|nr:hypothetical protein [Bacillus sp. USDA818B3_A]